jgi:divalent metal cation (Fe/Co/Zn/Cd) transporter
MKIKIKALVSTRYVGSTVEDEFEIDVDDDSTEEEIEEIAESVTREWMFEQIDWGYKIEKL